MNQAKLQILLARAHYDLAAAQSAALVCLGDRLGLYAALDGLHLTAEQLGSGTGIHPRWLQPWLINQAAAGFISYRPADDTYSLDEEQSAVFAPDGELRMIEAFDLAVELTGRLDAVENAMRRGTGVDPNTLGTSIDVDPAKVRQVDLWLEGEWSERLTRGASVAEVGCGEGKVLRHLASRFPKSTFLGIDITASAITEGNLRIVRGEAESIPAASCDLVLSIESLHELSRPEEAARAIRTALRERSSWILAEPLAEDTAAGNLNPAGRLLASTDVLYCLPSSLWYGGAGIGPLAGERALREILMRAGFSDVRRLDDSHRVVLEALR